MRARLSGVVNSWKTEFAMVSMSIRERLISARPRRENVEEIVDEAAHFPGVFTDDRADAPALVVKARSIVLGQDAGESVDGTERRPQIVGDRIGESLEFLVGLFELLGALRHALLQLGIQAAGLVFRPLAVGDVVDGAD